MTGDREAAARDACCWEPDPGRLWHRRDKLPWPTGARVLIAISVVLWLWCIAWAAVVIDALVSL